MLRRVICSTSYASFPALRRAHNCRLLPYCVTSGALLYHATAASAESGAKPDNSTSLTPMQQANPSTPWPTTLKEYLPLVSDRMNHFDVLRELLPLVQAELGAAINPVSLYASMQAMSRWQSAHRNSKVLPGKPAMLNHKLDGELISTAYRVLRFATATYGWKGMMFFYLTDPSSSYGFGDFGTLLKTSLLGDAASFCRFAGVPRDALLYESPAAALGMPKHFIVADEESRNIVLAIRGTMSLNDAFTDLTTDSLPFANGYAHKGICHAAHHVFGTTYEVLLAELERRPGWNVVITGHSLGAATAILVTILLHHLRDKQRLDAKVPKDSVMFGNVDVRCIAFAPAPVFAPLTALSEETQASILCWVNNEDLISRLSVDSIRDLVRILSKISAHEPSIAKRFFSDVDIQAVLDSEPEWLRSWTGKEEEVGQASGATTDQRFEIPGVIYCFRAPVDVGASSALRDYSRRSDEPPPAPAPTPETSTSPPNVETTTGASVVDVDGLTGADKDTGSPSAGASAPRTVSPKGELPAVSKSAEAPNTGFGLASFGSAVQSGWWSVASAAGKVATTAGSVASSTITGIGSSVASAASTLSSAVSGQPTRSGGRADSTDGDDIQLEPGVAAEAAARAQTEDLPFVTITRPNHLRNLPITQRSWRDHVPDMYLNVMRQLKEVADRQTEAAAAAQAGHPGLATPTHGSIPKHYAVGGEGYVKIDAESERTGRSKGGSVGGGEEVMQHLREVVTSAEEPQREAVRQQEAEEKNRLGEDGESGCSAASASDRSEGRGMASGGAGGHPS